MTNTTKQNYNKYINTGKHKNKGKIKMKKELIDKHYTHKQQVDNDESQYNTSFIMLFRHQL